MKLILLRDFKIPTWDELWPVPFEYKSVEKFQADFKTAIQKAHKQGLQFCNVAGIGFDVSEYVFRGELREPPTVMTLKDWFVSRLESGCKISKTFLVYLIS